MSKRKITTKQLVYSAVAIALGMVASYIKIIEMPNGGSVTLLSMLFVSIVGYWYGAGWGMLAGAVYGILQFMMKPYFVAPIQFLLDYPLAFGALGLSGLFANKKFGLTIGYIVGVLGRFVCSGLSGIIFYTTYTNTLSGNVAAIWGSIVYNLSYLLPELIVTVVIISIPAVSKVFAEVKKNALR